MLFRSPYKFVPDFFGPETPVSGRIDENELMRRSDNWFRATSRAKHFVRNLSVPNAIRETMLAYCGTITPVGGTAEASRAFNFWAQSANYQTGTSLWEMNSDLIGNLVWGDCLVTAPVSPYAAPNEIAFRVKLIDPLSVDTPPKYADGNLHDGIRVVLGVVFDSHDIEIGYFVRKASGSRDSDYTYIPRFDPITGRFISFLVRRPHSLFPGQVRSFAMFAKCMNEVRDTDKLLEAAVHAGINKSLLAVLLRNNSPYDTRRATGNIGPDGKPISSASMSGIHYIGSIRPGSVGSLPADTDPIVISHAGNVDLVALIKMNLQLIAAAVNIPYEILLSSFLGINFSAGKLSYDKMFRTVDAWNYGPIEYVMRHIYRWVVAEHFTLHGRIPSPEDLTCEWIGPSAPDPDPQKSANANQLNVSLGVLNRSDIVGRKGVDYETHLLQRRRDSELEARMLGHSFLEQFPSAPSPISEIEEDEHA